MTIIHNAGRGVFLYPFWESGVVKLNVAYRAEEKRNDINFGLSSGLENVPTESDKRGTANRYSRFAYFVNTSQHHPNTWILTLGWNNSLMCRRHTTLTDVYCLLARRIITLDVCSGHEQCKNTKPSRDSPRL